MVLPDSCQWVLLPILLCAHPQAMNGASSDLHGVVLRLLVARRNAKVVVEAREARDRNMYVLYIK